MPAFWGWIEIHKSSLQLDLFFSKASFLASILSDFHNAFSYVLSPWLNLLLLGCSGKFLAWEPPGAPAQEAED